MCSIAGTAQPAGIRRIRLTEQREHLDLTLAEQSKQLDRTLAEQRTRTWNERFATAADQLGSDKPAAVRLAGVYAMAGLADDWEANRQTCVDVLCGYLRMPYEPDPGEESSAPEQLAFRSGREVRHTIIRVITSHLKEDASVPWRGLDFDFTGVVFDGGSFSDAQFSGGFVNFDSAEFSGGAIDFYDAKFSGGVINFNIANFFDGSIDFNRAEFSGGVVNFIWSKFSGAQVDFSEAKFSGGKVSFLIAEFSGGVVNFGDAEFSGGTIDFTGAEFSGTGVYFNNARFSGATVDFSNPSSWSCPPEFPWVDTPPSGVKVPGISGETGSATGA